jgi:hypothetical protein
MKKILYMLLVPLLWTACEEDNPEPAVELTNTSDVTLTADASRFNALKDNRSSDPFEIRNILRDGNIIQVIIQYSGGCEPHEFEVLWNRELDELENGHYGISMTDLMITHNANGDMCEAAITDTLSIALSDLSHQVDWDFYGVRIINGSSQQSVVSTLLMEPVWESEECLVEVVLERVICGDGLLENAWFRYADQNYFQPASLASLIQLDPDLPEGNYRIGVKVTTWDPNPDTAICAAFPGWSVPVEIWCLEKID